MSLFVKMRVWKHTQQRLKLLAAMEKQSMIQLIDSMTNEHLHKLFPNGLPDSWRESGMKTRLDQPRKKI